MKYVLAAALTLAAAALPAAAQESDWMLEPEEMYESSTEAAVEVLGTGKVYYSGQRQRLSKPPKQRLIDWLPEGETPQRYTIAIRPLQLFNNGLKADFEFELNKPGRWLQFSLAGYYAPQYDYTITMGEYSFEDYWWGAGWENFMSDGETFEKLSGMGIGIAYKHIFSNSGWYWSAGISFSYYDLSQWISGYGYYDEYGTHIYLDIYDTVNSKNYQSEANVNIGKHFALGRNVFLDVYAGIGGRYTFIVGFDNWYMNDGLQSYQYTGFCVNAGFRLGWMWSNRK